MREGPKFVRHLLNKHLKENAKGIHLVPGLYNRTLTPASTCCPLGRRVPECCSPIRSQELGLPSAMPVSKAAFSVWREEVKQARVKALGEYLGTVAAALVTRPDSGVGGESACGSTGAGRTWGGGRDARRAWLASGGAPASVARVSSSVSCSRTRQSTIVAPSPVIDEDEEDEDGSTEG